MKNTEKIYWKDLVEEAIKRRKEQKMTQKELAAFVGISTPTLQKFEDKKYHQYYFGCLFENSASLRLSKLRLIENQNLCSCIHWYFLYFSISFNSRKGIG